MTHPLTLTGLAIGDALGMPFETHHFSSNALAVWDGSFQSGTSNKIQPARKAGEWTDDTKMATALAESLIETSTYNPPYTAAKYVDWYKSGDLRGIGKTTRAAIERLLTGYHWDNSGIPHAEGNGTAMRAAPIGLYFRKNLITVANMARIDATLTHQSVEAQEGSAAVALAVALLANKMVDRKTLLIPIVNLLHSDPSSSTITGVESRLLGLQDFLSKPPTITDVFKRLIEQGTGAHVVETVPAAFLCFMVTDSFRDAVELAVRAGGDTDTTAAITGALAGTFYGRSELEPYLEQLETADYLQHLDRVMWLEAPEFPQESEEAGVE